IWGAALGVLCRWLFGGRTTFLIVAGLVISHWILDVVVHRPDMPIYPGSAKFGLSMWNSVPATVIVELAAFSAGVLVYAKATRPRDGVGRWSLVALVLFLLIAYGANLAGGTPPSVAMIYATAMAGSVVILIWSWWADRHRSIAQSRG
ncbi:MAG TPA: hypothetical protein VLV86_12595, partial [Vicinamibacterales bacterium]|nr:hypothetical protein [Vicinamibacterales bacterium]